jgi:hypothetical protein
MRDDRAGVMAGEAKALRAGEAVGRRFVSVLPQWAVLGRIIGRRVQFCSGRAAPHLPAGILSP